MLIPMPCDGWNVRARSLTALTASLALTACMSMSPPYRAPPLPVADQYPADAPTVPGSVGTLDWRDIFIDAGLQALIEESWRNNRDLRAAMLRVEEARARSNPDLAQVRRHLTATPGSARRSTRFVIGRTGMGPGAARAALEPCRTLRSGGRRCARSVRIARTPLATRTTCRSGSSEVL